MKWLGNLLTQILFEKNDDKSIASDDLISEFDQSKQKSKKILIDLMCEKN